MSIEGPQDRKMGWEVAREIEATKRTILERLVPDVKHLRAAAIGMLVLFGVFLLATWLAGNPFDGTRRIASAAVKAKGWAGTNEWGILWGVVAIAMFFEFMDASAGMGFGTALTPLLLVMGFDPTQIVPAVMIQQGIAGLVGAFLHREFENVEWRFRPMSATIFLWLIIAGTGSVLVFTSVYLTYVTLKIGKVWIQLYVALLLVGMGAVSLFRSRKERPYRPWKMVGFAALAGFNKGVGGGGYGPVVTIGGILSGIPVKSLLAITALAEGTVSTVAIAAWITTFASGGATVDYVLLPSLMLATIFSAVAAPYATRVFPEKAWKIVVPAYCLILAAYSFYEIVPKVMKQLGG